jgi:hypothetical protein
MAKVKVSLEVEYETTNELAAGPSLIRIPGDLTHSIERGAVPGMPTGVKGGSVKVTILRKEIDGKILE